MNWEWLFGEGSWWQIVFPVLIFFARVCDVTLGTLRMVAVSREQKAVAAMLGFFEVLIWLTAVSYILQHLTTVINYFAYAGGFAAGNYLGLKIEEKLALGLVQVTIITNRDARPLIEELRRQDFGLTSVSAMGATGRVRMVITVVRRRDLERLRRLVEAFHPHAFMTVQSLREASKPIQPNRESMRRPWLFLRKAK